MVKPLSNVTGLGELIPEQRVASHSDDSRPRQSYLLENPPSLKPGSVEQRSESIPQLDGHVAGAAVLIIKCAALPWLPFLKFELEYLQATPRPHNVDKLNGRFCPYGFQLAQPDNYPFGSRIYLVHFSHLLILFFDIVLVDAYRVNPEKSGVERKPQLEQCFFEIFRDSQFGQSIHLLLCRG
jgi:hypothetical protein